MRDYTGDMSFYQNQLSEVGISKEMLNMDNYVGLTISQLQSIVDYAKQTVMDRRLKELK